MIHAQQSKSCRGFTLIAVLVTMGSALLMGTSLLFLAQAEVAGSVGTGAAAHSRALAWSGMEILMSQLNDQRQAILDGETIQLDDEYIIYETDTRLGVVRLLPIALGGGRVSFEAGKLDLNSITAETLTATELVEIELAEEIIHYRDNELRRPYQSIAELLGVSGMTPEIIYGQLDEMIQSEEIFDASQDLTLDSNFDEAPRGLADVVTVYSFGPSIQQSGRLRINLNQQWSEELGRRVEERFGRDVSDTLRRIMVDESKSFDSDKDLFEVLRFFNLEPEAWPEIVDTFTTLEDEFYFSRVDINTASYEVLVALGGFTEEEANAIVQMRGSLTPSDLATIAWPAIEGIVEPISYDELAGHITTRCWTYRLRLAAGEVDAEQSDGPLKNPVIYEIVVDLAGPQTRLAYIREITLLDTVTTLANYASNQDEEPFEQLSRIETVLDDWEGDLASEEDMLIDDSPFPFDDEDTDAPMDDPLFDDPEVPTSNAPSSSTPSSSSSNSRRRIGRWTNGG